MALVYKVWQSPVVLQLYTMEIEDQTMKFRVVIDNKLYRGVY